MVKSFDDMSDQEAQRHLDEHHGPHMEMKFSVSPITWDARMRRCWREYHYWVHKTKECDHDHREPGVKKPKGDKETPNKALDVEAPEKFRLEDYPGLQEAVDAFEEQCGSSYGESTGYHMKRAMDALAAAGWKFKPAKKIRPDKLSKSEIVWQELDSVMDRLMTDGDGASESDKGEAYGLALALAVMKDPHDIDVDAIRADSLERWEARNGD